MSALPPEPSSRRAQQLRECRHRRGTGDCRRGFGDGRPASMGKIIRRFANEAHVDRVQRPGAKPVKTHHIHSMVTRLEITRKELLHGARKAVDSLKKRLMDRIAETRRRGRAAQQKDRDQHRQR